MSQIVKYACAELAGAEVTCVTVDGEQWFRGVEVAKVLGYKKPSGAVYDHVTSKVILAKLLNKQKGLDLSLSQSSFINRQGVRELVAKSQRPEAFAISAQTGVKVETRYIRKELEIIGFVQEFLTTLNIPFEFQKSVLSYRVDLYLPQHKIAVEIDELGHADRDPNYEADREKRITEHLQCKFIGFNPDEPNFKMSHCIAKLTHYIFRA